MSEQYSVYYPVSFHAKHAASVLTWGNFFWASFEMSVLMT